MFLANDVRGICQPPMHPARLFATCLWVSVPRRHRERQIIQRGLLKSLRLAAVPVGQPEIHEFGAARSCAITSNASKRVLLHCQLIDPELVVQHHIGSAR